jgi:hypothetical protein
VVALLLLSLSTAQEAATLVKRARALQDAGRCREAGELLQRSLGIHPHPKTTYFLALNESCLGRVREAQRLLEAIRNHPSMQGKADQEALEQLRVALSNKLLPVAVTVESEPTGAWVQLGGKAEGRTPLTLHLEPGVHSIGIGMDGFVSETHNLAVAAQTPATVAVKLRGVPTADPASLGVSSIPVGAALSVDGAARGQTPAALTLPPGEHRLRLQLLGHAEHDQTVILAEGENRRLEIALAAEATAPPALLSPPVPPPSAARATLLIAGAASVVAGGGFFAKHFLDQQELEQMDQGRGIYAQSPVNLLVGATLGALGLAAVAAGLAL